MKVEYGARGRGYDSDHHNHHRSHNRHHRHSNRHHSNNVTAGMPPYYEQQGESSSGSMGSLPQNNGNPNRPPSVASVGAWIKAKSADWFNQSDPFGAMSLYLQTMKNFRDRRSHHHSGGGHHHRRSHHHDHDSGGERRHHHSKHRHHRRHEPEYNPEALAMNGFRPKYEDDPNLADSSQPTYPHRGSRRSSSANVEGLQDVEMEDRAQSSSFSDIPPVEKHTKKRKKVRERNEVQRRDRVVVVCYIVVNCLLAAIGIGVAVLSGLAAWKPEVYKPFYKSEVARIFADMYKLPNACGKNFDKFILSPAIILPGAFQAIFACAVALGGVAVLALFIPLIASRTPRMQALHVALHIMYIIAMMAFTAVTAAYLCIYFQNIDQIEANMRINAKSAYLTPFKGNPMKHCDPISNFVNFIHRYFRCCGVDDGHDFEDQDLVPDFDGTVVNDGEVYENEEDRPTYRVPLSCCRLGRFYEPDNSTHSDSGGKKGVTKNPFKGRRPRGWILDLCRRVDSPLYGFSDRTSYMRIGCWPIVKEFFTQPARVGLISLGVFCLVMLFAATLSFLQTRLC